MITSRKDEKFGVPVLSMFYLGPPYGCKIIFFIVNFFVCVGTLKLVDEKSYYWFCSNWDMMSNADMFMGFEDFDGDDDIREEFPCPFCSEYYDIVGLCCHIDDEHPMEAKNGVC